MITGYVERWVYRPGDRVDVKVSCYDGDAGRCSLELVRLRRGAIPPQAVVEETVEGADGVEFDGREQQTDIGSYLRAGIADWPENEAWTVGILLWPTMPDRPQQVMGLCGGRDKSLCLGLVGDCGSLRVVGADLSALVEVSDVLAVRKWVLVLLRYRSADRRLQLTVVRLEDSEVTEAVARWGGPTPRVEEMVVGRLTPSSSEASFNGKAASPFVTAGLLSGGEARRLARGEGGRTFWEGRGERFGFWDLSRDQQSMTIPGSGDLAAGGARCVNMPARGVTGPFWRGDELSWTRSGEGHDAVYLHEDDLEDARWMTSASITVPRDSAPGVYACKVRRGDQVERIPMVVRRQPAALRDVALVLPTWSYMAYANWRSYAVQQEDRIALYGERRECDQRDRWLVEHPELGKSMYDKHPDGSGVAYSSRRRPVINMRPDYFTPSTKGLRHFGEDMELVHWLENTGYEIDILTDDCLHDEGVDLLGNYRVVVSGSHPEYCSLEMLEAIESYVQSGGRFMYLGGNGFYWVTGRHREAPYVIEIRRTGNAIWTGEPGESYLSTTGEPGGRWRHRGRPPQRLFGVGFTAQGFDAGGAYARSKASYHPEINWVFAGVTEDPFGGSAGSLGGAAGDEIDRADFELGTPTRAWVLASSTGHSDRFVLTQEDQRRGPSGAFARSDRSLIRADVVALGYPHGGAVFSCGSIAWALCLGANAGDNDVNRISSNVLRRFVEGRGEVIPPATAV